MHHYAYIGGIKMRTTLNIDDEILNRLKEMANNSKKPFRQVVNEALSVGIGQLERPCSTPYSLRQASLGGPRAGINIHKALSLSDELENEAVITRLELRK